jgi:hypothetical protein
MKGMIKKERYDQCKLTMMVSHFFHLLDDVLLSLSLMVIGTVSTTSFPSLVNWSMAFLNHSSM